MYAETAIINNGSLETDLVNIQRNNRSVSVERDACEAFMRHNEIRAEPSSAVAAEETFVVATSKCSTCI